MRFSENSVKKVLKENGAFKVADSNVAIYKEILEKDGM